MSGMLPAGCEFVSEVGIGTEELLDLFEDGIRVNEPLEGGVPVEKAREPFVDMTAGEDDIHHMALGVGNALGKLIAYTSATIDERDSHATVDYMVVDRAEADEGIGKALADAGLDMLDRSGVKTVSFEVFGQARKLVPYLVSTQGFVYDALNQEYISNRALVRWSDGEPAESDAAITIPRMVEDEALRQVVSVPEMIEYRDAVSRIIRASARYARSHDIPVLSNDNFQFELAGRSLQVSENVLLGSSYWNVLERGSAELVASPHGVVMATERNYEVSQHPGEAQPGHPEYAELQEIRGSDGAMRPFVAPKGQEAVFTKARYQRLMSSLRRLSPEHLVPDSEHYDDLSRG